VSKAQYDIYIDKVKDLANTLVVKSEAAADAINADRKELGYDVNAGDPTTWKYYLNVSGQYHSSDTPMTVISLDTLQTIDFTKDNLQIHLTTAREYTYGSRYYNDLLSRFPEQELLIQGILHPVDLTKAINAPDAAILWFDTTLVEDNEENLIAELQDWINRFMVRWDVPAYRLADDLYAASQLAMLYLGIVLEILNIRLANCKTRFAHSYHIREYLASNGRLDAYVDNLTKKQMLWLYRNILYIQRNAGKQDTFQSLTKNILTDRGLPLVGWNMRHNLTHMPDNLVPDIEFERAPINYGLSSAGTDTRTVGQLLEAEVDVAKGNARVELDAETTITEQMELSLNDRLQTKVLESAILDLTDSSPFTLSDALLNHWMYFAKLGFYNAIITVDNPHTGGTYTFNMLDAFVVWLYAYNASHGIVLQTLPVLQAIHVRRIPPPTKAELLGIIDQKWVDPTLVDAAFQNLPPVANHYISTEGFYNAALAIHDGELYHRFLYATQEHYIARGQVEQMTQRFYQDYTVDLGGQTYTAWFAERGLDIASLTDLEQDLLATQVLSVATGANLKKSQSLKEMQAAMLAIMTQLSSYSVQYLQSINSDPIRVPDSPVIRLGDTHVHAGDLVPVDALDVRVVDTDGSASALYDLDLAESLVDYTASVRAHRLEQADFTLDFTYSGLIELRETIPLADFRILRVIESTYQASDVTVTRTNDYVPLTVQPLTEAFTSLQSPNYTLTSAERTTLATRWQAYRDASGPLKEPLDEVIADKDLPGLTYPELITLRNTDLGGLTYPVPVEGDPDLDGLTYPFTD
jgi:hypothetical protein